MLRSVYKIFLLLLTAIIFISPGTSLAQSPKLQPLFSITGADMEIPLNQPSDVFVDEQHNEIYVSDAGNRRIVVFDMDGFYKYDFQIPGKSELTGLLVDNRGEILVVLDGKIAIYDFRGGFLQYVDIHGFFNAENVKATRIKTDKQNNYYVLDAANRRVLVFDNQWNFKMDIGKENFPKSVRNLTHGKKQEESMVQDLSMGDICVDDGGRIYILDIMASYVFVFDKDGKYQRSIGEPGAAFNTLGLPFGVAVDSQGRILVTNCTSHGLLGYDKEGKFLFAVGGLGNTLGRFYFPKYVSADGDSRIYVVEPFLSRIQVLTVE